MSIYIDELLQAKKVLLLQGPVGPFFADFANWLATKQIQCYKVNFNAGDWRYYFARPNIWHFRKKSDQFMPWLQHKVQSHRIDAIVCFGDCRFYHVKAKQLAQQLGVAFYVFEEGYVRPDYISFEADGVNNFSNFKPLFAKQTNQPMKVDTQKTDNRFRRMIICSLQYYLFWTLFFWLYPFYQHHRGYNPLQELYYWVISGLRRFRNAYTEPQKFNDLINKYDQAYFIFALQVHNDFQIRIHSDYRQVEDAIYQAIYSFAQYADSKHHLVFKHHPMDRGYRNYSRYIYKMAQHFGVEERVHYLCDVHLPTLLKHSLGLVTINSTTGIQALYHRIPVKVLGRAIYDLPQLTNQHDLDQFWQTYDQCNEDYFNSFRNALIITTQLNGAYYGKHFWMK